MSARSDCTRRSCSHVDSTTAHFIAHCRQVVCGLQIHPELGRILKVACQKKRCLRRDSALSAYYFVHAIQWDGERPGEIGLSQLQRLEEFLQEDLAGMSGDAMFG
jgi:hypothetical protein